MQCGKNAQEQKGCAQVCVCVHARTRHTLRRGLRASALGRTSRRGAAGHSATRRELRAAGHSAASSCAVGSALGRIGLKATKPAPKHLGRMGESGTDILCA